MILKVPDSRRKVSSAPRTHLEIFLIRFPSDSISFHHLHRVLGATVTTEKMTTGTAVDLTVLWEGLETDLRFTKCVYSIIGLVTLTNLTLRNLLVQLCVPPRFLQPPHPPLNFLHNQISNIWLPLFP